MPIRLPLLLCQLVCHPLPWLSHHLPLLLLLYRAWPAMDITWTMKARMPSFHHHHRSSIYHSILIERHRPPDLVITVAEGISALIRSRPAVKKTNSKHSVVP